MTVESAVAAVSDGRGHQTVEITVHQGYHPSSVIARAGIPLRILFQRLDDDPCTERVVFSSPRADRRLAAVGATTIELPAYAPGQIRFTCGMGRYRGQIDVVGGSAGSFRTWLHARLSPWAPGLRREAAHLGPHGASDVADRPMEVHRP